MFATDLNLKKAVDEHLSLNPQFPLWEADESTPLVQSEAELEFSHQFADDIGSRERMEDAHFYTVIDQGILAGVFDGHGGRDVAEYASEQFQKLFSETLHSENGDVPAAFTSLINRIQIEIEKNPEWDTQGSAAVITFIDKKTSMIYTATLGDCEANQYRKNGNDEMRSIPLSCVRDWGSPDDAQRLETVHGLDPGSVTAYLQRNPHRRKYVRSQGIDARFGVNVSRGFGDKSEKPQVSHEPVFTISRLQKGDIVILACDGLKDFVSEQRIAETVGERAEHGSRATIELKGIEDALQNSSNIVVKIYYLICRFFFNIRQQNNIAQTLVNMAPDNDNVTVLVIQT